MLKRIVPLVLALVLCAGLAQAKTKAPATQLPGDLTLAEAQKVLDAALVKAKAQGVPMNIAIVDAGGNLKAFVRQDGAFIGSIDVSTKKAVTARYFNNAHLHAGRRFPARSGTVRHRSHQRRSGDLRRR